MARPRRRGLGLDDFDASRARCPVIANVRPSGDKYLMEDFFYAGGLPALMKQLRASSTPTR
jgi:dihydroxyacid dehydratase/phosphogluconate dehydratase